MKVMINAHCPGSQFVHSYTKFEIREYLLNHVSKNFSQNLYTYDSDHAFKNTILTKKLAQETHNSKCQLDERKAKTNVQQKSQWNSINSFKANTRKSSPACHKLERLNFGFQEDILILNKLKDDFHRIFFIYTTLRSY